jgi:hypothetical protein
MPFLPHRRYELVSTKNPWEVEAAMRAAVEPKRFFGFGAASRPFEGEVGDRMFDVQRAIGYRNSFLPQIRGSITVVGGRVSTHVGAAQPRVAADGACASPLNG